MDATRAAGVTCVVWALCCLQLQSLGSCCARRCVQRALPQVVAAPVVGKLARVAVDRTIGTVLGGTSGFGAYVGYKCLPTYTSSIPWTALIFVALCVSSSALPETESM